MGTCIGHYNRQYFINFLFYVTLVAIMYVIMMMDFDMKSKNRIYKRKLNILFYVLDIDCDWSLYSVSLDCCFIGKDNYWNMWNYGWLQTILINLNEFSYYLWNNQYFQGFATNLSITDIQRVLMVIFKSIRFLSHTAIVNPSLIINIELSLSYTNQ